MANPHIEFLPLHPALPAATRARLDVLVRVHAPEVEKAHSRPRLNLALSIDRSGSMEGEKLAFAKRAAHHAVELLQAGDRFSVLAFSDEVEAIAMGGGAEEKESLHLAIEAIDASGSTALHAGWTSGAAAVRAALEEGQLARVIVLSDGQANRGETRPVRIAEHVRREAAEGVSTTTLGVGTDFNEDLLEAMAKAGDGDYHFIESASQIPELFAVELAGLSATFGRKCSLGFEPAEGVRVVEVLNDLELNPLGRFKLPNLMHTRPLEVVVRVEVGSNAVGGRLFKTRFAWTGAEGMRQRVHTECELPVLPVEAFHTLAANPEVAIKVALLQVARARREAVRKIDLGDFTGARDTLLVAMEQLPSQLSHPELLAERHSLRDLLNDLDSGNSALARKKSTSQNFDLQRSKPRRFH